MSEENLKEFKAPDNYGLTEVVYMAERIKEEIGEDIIVKWHNHDFKSKGLTVEKAFLDVYNYDAKPNIESTNQLREEKKHRREKMSEGDNRRINEYKELRKQASEEEKEITPEKIVNGLKYIAEHTTQTQDELVKGLENLNCFWTYNDVIDQLKFECNFQEGMRTGIPLCGAKLITIIRDSENDRDAFTKRFFGEDDDFSAYHYIRTVTQLYGKDFKDKEAIPINLNYTKEYVNSLKNNSDGLKH